MIVLASQSPRRAELLTQMGVAFNTLHIEVDETQWADELPYDYVLRLARSKAATGWQQSIQQPPVLGADTIVVCEQQVLGKPRDMADAQRMLSLLSGRTHQVYTAVALSYAGGQVAEVVQTAVRFCRLNEAQISAYWHSGEPQDKAGSYAIQGFAGQFVEHISGSYSAVVGLPMYETRQLLNQIGYES